MQCLLKQVLHDQAIGVNETSQKGFPTGIVSRADTGADGVRMISKEARKPVTGLL
jgi:hypothetical protein